MKLRKLSCILFVTCASLLGQKIEPSSRMYLWSSSGHDTKFWKIESQNLHLYWSIFVGRLAGGKKSETAHANELRIQFCFNWLSFGGVELLPAAIHDAARAVQFLRFSGHRIGTLIQAYRRNRWLGWGRLKHVACLPWWPGQSKEWWSSAS